MFSCSSGASIVDCCFLLVLLVMNSADTWTFLSSIVLVFTLGKMCSIVGTLHSRIVVHFDIEESRQSNKSCPKWMGLQWQRELCEGMICSMDLTHRLTRCTCPWPIRTLRAGWHRDRSQSCTLLGCWLSLINDDGVVESVDAAANQSPIEITWSWALNWLSITTVHSIFTYRSHGRTSSVHVGELSRRLLHLWRQGNEQKVSWMHRRDYSATVNPMAACV